MDAETTEAHVAKGDRYRDPETGEEFEILGLFEEGAIGHTQEMAFISRAGHNDDALTASLSFIRMHWEKIGADINWPDPPGEMPPLPTHSGHALATITPRLIDVVQGLRNQRQRYLVDDDAVTPALLLLLRTQLETHIDELSQIAQVAVLAANLEDSEQPKKRPGQPKKPRLWCTSGHCTSPVVYVDADGRHWCEGCGEEWGNEIERIDQ